MIADEIQSGLGRTGKLFAYEHENIVPDVVIVGKALSGGFYPVSAVLSSRRVLGVFRPGDHGSTFGGNPLGCAVARTALRVLVEEKMVENSAELGGYFRQELRKLQSPLIKEIRGRGLWIGIELTTAARPYCEAIERPRRSVQRDAREGDPAGAAVGDHARRDRLGDGANSEGAGVKLAYVHRPKRSRFARPYR